MSSLKRLESDLSSIRALASLLRDVCSKPSDYLNDAALIAGLRSQGSLARHASSERKIHAMSLNHQKRIAEQEFGNYTVLDALRKAAANALAGAAEVSTRDGSSKDGLKARIRELEAERTLLLQDLYVVQRAYDLRCVQARGYANAADAGTRERCAKEQKELDASFSLRKKVLTATNVTPMNEARSHGHPKT